MKSSRLARLSAISAGLCVVLVVLWIRSHYVGDQIWLPRSIGGTLSQLRVALGTINYSRYPGWPAPAKPSWTPFRVDEHTAHRLDVVYKHRLGFAFERDEPDLRVGVPYWFLVLVTGILPVGYLLRLRKTARVRSSGQCRVCGYDLRATPNRCPECGAIASR